MDDGPRTFTLADCDGGLCLAHWLDGDRDANRFAVVPVTEKWIARLKRGELSLLEILDQPRLYVVDLANAGTVLGIWLTRFAEIPQDSLPRPGTMIYPDLAPVPGTVPAR
jgi:hypothetical protein